MQDWRAKICTSSGGFTIDIKTNFAWRICQPDDFSPINHHFNQIGVQFKINLNIVQLIEITVGAGIGFEKTRTYENQCRLKIERNNVTVIPLKKQISLCNIIHWQQDNNRYKIV